MIAFEELFKFLSDTYVQRADDRQKAMNLVYTEAETHDLARQLVKFINSRPKTLVSNINIDGPALTELVRSTVANYLSDTEAQSIPETDIRKHMEAYDPGAGTSAERHARLCEEVANQSRNSLFRTGAKICAGVIRDSKEIENVNLPVEQWAGIAVASGEALDNYAKALNFNPRAHLETDALFRKRIQNYYFKAPPITPENFQQEYMITPPLPGHEADRRFVKSVNGSALDMVGGRYGLRRMKGNRPPLSVESDESYRARIIEKIDIHATTDKEAWPEMSDTDKANGSVGAMLDLVGSRFGVTRKIISDSLGAEPDELFRQRVIQRIRDSEAGKADDTN